MERNSGRKSSKELLYSEYTGTTVAGHVLERLKQKTNMSLKEKIDLYKKSTVKSETFERIKKFMSVIDENPTMNICNDADKGEIEVTMEINENASESNPDAWFVFNQAEDEDASDDESKSSDGESEQNSPVSSTQRSIVDLTDSSDSSDNSDASLTECLEDPVHLPICKERLECHCNNDSLSACDSDKKFVKLFPSSGCQHFHHKSKKMNQFVGEQGIRNPKEKNCYRKFFTSIDASDTDSSNCVPDNFVQNNSYSCEKKNVNVANNQSLNIPDNESEHILSFSAEKKNLNVVENGFCNQLRDGCVQNICSLKKNLNVVDSDSLNPSLEGCSQNISFSTGKKNLNVVNDNFFEFSIVAFDVSAPVEKEKLNDSESEAAELSESKGLQLLSAVAEKRKKICIIEDDFYHVDGLQQKKICLQKNK